MRRIPVLPTLFAFALALAGPGCRPAPEPGRLVLVDGADREVEFGSEFPWDSSTRQVWLRNDGGQALTLTDAVVQEGHDEVWAVALPSHRVLEPGKTAAIEVTFSASLSAADSPHHEATIRIDSAHTRDGSKAESITLRARGITLVGECYPLPSTLEFGNVGLGHTYRRQVEIRNRTERTMKVGVGDITPRDGEHLAFFFSPDSATGEVELAPGTSMVIEVDFAPAEERAYLATLKFDFPDHGCGRTVALRGVGAAQVVTWSPLEVDCGFVKPGTSARRTLTFTNLGLEDRLLRNLKVANGTEFAVEVPGDPQGPLRVPGEAGTLTVDVVCRPNVYGPRSTMLTFATDLVSQPQGQVPIRVNGGGPVIEVKPSPVLSFGKVAFFPGANPPASTQRTLTITNVGRAPAVPDNRANLRLGELDVNRESTRRYFLLEPLDEGTSAQEFEVIIPSSYDHQKGLAARTGEDSVALQVRLTPHSVGPKRARLTIFSNDPEAPETVVELTASVEEIPSCNLSVSASSLDFGVVGPPGYRELPLTLRNNGTAPDEVCLLWGLQLLPTGGQAQFSLPGGPIESHDLGPGQELTVVVRVQATSGQSAGVTPLQGELELFVSSLLRPRVLVALSAVRASSCLALTPRPLDFGTVKPGCASETRTVTVHNTCESELTLHAWDVRCGGMPQCSEFTVLQGPGTPPSGLTLPPRGAPIALQVQYRPVDDGRDQGTLTLPVTQDGQALRYVLPLTGRSDAQGFHVDHFIPRGTGPVDMILAVDSSPSMAPFEASLDANLGAFAQALLAIGADFRLGVIDANADPAGGEQGHFVTGSITSERFLTGSTDDLEAKLKDRIRAIRAQGSAGPPRCLDALWRALTAPAANGRNSGFLRPQSTLALVCIAASPDASIQTGAQALDLFWNIKGHDRKTAFSFNAVGPILPNPPSSCTHPNGLDTTLSEVISRSSGAEVDVCSASWSAALAEVAANPRPGLRYPLSLAPDLSQGAIEVQVNGALVPRADWAYAAAENLIVFDPVKAPTAGQHLSVRYPTFCRP